MAADLSGMFAQLNQAILNNPYAGETGTDLVNLTSRGLGQGIGAVTGADPMSFMTPQAKVDFGKNQLGQMDLSTSKGMAQAAELYGKMGMPEQQAAMATNARTLALEEETKRRTQKSRENLAARATKIGMSDMATNIAAGEVDLEQAAELIRDEELANLAATRTGGARKVLAERMGISPEMYDELGLADYRPEEFKDFYNGLEADNKPYQVTATGQLLNLPESKGGKVRYNGEWVWPSEAGLAVAPQVSKVFNQANAIAEGLTEYGLKNFEELNQEAQQAGLSLRNNAQAMELLNQGMNTGQFANLQSWFQKTAVALGAPDEIAADAARSEQFTSRRLEESGRVIQMFGAGTGLSDADAKRALQIAAGDITLTEESLRFLLEQERKVLNFITSENDRILDELEKSGDVDPATMSMLRISKAPPGSTQAGGPGGTIKYERDSTGKLVRVQ